MKEFQVEFTTTVTVMAENEEQAVSQAILQVSKDGEVAEIEDFYIYVDGNPFC